MEEIIHILTGLQIIFTIFISVPIIYWIGLNIRQRKIITGGDENENFPSITVLLPMRNESKNVVRKLEDTLSEVMGYEESNLLVVDSGSEDGTRELVSGYLRDSALDRSRWDVISFMEPGKSKAINMALERIETDVVIMSDADAKISPGWMRVVIERLSEESIGVVSGIEYRNNSSLDEFGVYYRSKSNWLRLQESVRGSTPVLEGSLIAWKVEALGDFKLNEEMNADDAQIGFASVRRGYRSIVDPRIYFEDFVERVRTWEESVRRAQGLCVALIKNLDLSIFSKVEKSRVAIINAVVLYVFFPWASILFATNSIVAYTIDAQLPLSWPTWSLIAMAVIIISKQGRSVIRGVLISIYAQLSLLLGKRYNIWNPVR